jgi:hypothetical protein
MVEQLEAIFDRIGRAQEHLQPIKGELLRYYRSDPCRMRGEFDPNQYGRREVMGPEATLAALGVRLNTLIGEFVHDLRSALDHLARQLVLVDKGTPTGSSRFPILARPPRAKKYGKHPFPSVSGGVSLAARTLIDEAQPYKFGARYAEHPLWVLHKLWNIDKHRDVIARGGMPQLHFVGDMPPFSYTSRLESATEYGAKLLLVPDDPEMNVNAYATFHVTLHEPGDGIEDPPLLETFEAICQTVLGVASTAEDRCF